MTKKKARHHVDGDGESPSPTPDDSGSSRRVFFAAVAATIVVLGVLYWFFPGSGNESPQSAGEGGRPDIILITIDTLRADALGYSGNQSVSTPFLDRIASEGVTFSNAHAHNVVTLPSHANIITGLLPYQHGVRENAGFVLGEVHRTLGALLRDEGYATAAFVAAFPLDQRYGLNRGFDVYDDKYPEGSAPTAFVTPERPAPEVLEPAIRWFNENRGRGRFLWVHVYDPHFPYAPPSPYRERHPENPYYGEVEATDAALNRYLTPILAGNPNILLIVTADHGEALGEHGETTHGLFAYEESLHVPLIVWEGGVIEARRDERYVRHIDIVPTVLGRVGAPVPATLTGKSLLQMDDSRDTYFESLGPSLNHGWAPLVGLIHEGHKYIEQPIPELYDLENDPDELDNILEENRRMTFRIRELMKESAPLAASANRDISDEESAQLLSLGYVTGVTSKTEFTRDDDLKIAAPFHARLNDVVASYQLGDRDEAIRIAETLVHDRPEMQSAKTMLSFLLQEAEKPDDAIAMLLEEVEKGTASRSMKRRLGQILNETGRSAEAVEIMREFAASEDPDLLNTYGIALAESGKPAEAVRVFEKVLAIDKTNASAYENLGVVALKAGDGERAYGYLRQALDFSPDLPLALNTLGVVFAQRGQNDQALESWIRSVRLDPKQYDALFNISVVAGQAGRWEVAREALTQFIRTAPPERYGPDLETARQMLAEINRRVS